MKSNQFNVFFFTMSMSMNISIVIMNPFYLYLYVNGIHGSLIQTKKICRDCKFFIAHNKECRKFGQVDLVTGVKHYNYAYNAREDEDKCGEIAKYYEKNNFKMITVPYYLLLNYWSVFPLVGYMGFIIYVLLWRAKIEML